MGQRVEQLCAWAGPTLIVLMGVGLAGISGLFPPPSPRETGRQIQALYVHHETGIRIGMVMCMIGSGLLAPWTIGLAHQLKKTSNAHPVLTHIQTAAGAIAVVVGTSFSLIVSVAAFRPETLAPATTRLLDDIAWYWWLIPWPLFTVWCIAVGALILGDTSPTRVFPRWSGYLSVWCAALYPPGSLCLFFKHGPFSFNGVVVWYIPTVSFFVWILVMTPLMIAAARGGSQAQPDQATAVGPGLTTAPAGA